MRRIIVAFASVTIPAVAFAGGADPRALEACKSASTSFVQVAECLPPAHVAIKTLDAFAAIYPPAAQPLRSKCVELNGDNIAGAAACVSNAIQSAMKLSASLPQGTTLDDPIFEAIIDPALEKRLREAESSAKADFPEQSFWGGGLYRPYK